MKPQTEHDMTDFEIFAKTLYSYVNACKKSDEDKLSEMYHKFIESIKDLKCNDFRFFYHLAYYQNNHEKLEKAKHNIDESIRLIASIKSNGSVFKENHIIILTPIENAHIPVPLPTIKQQIADVFYCAGEIYAKYGLQEKSLEYYQMSQYYKSFLKSEFEGNDSISLFSFRRYNEYSLTDLINNTITVSPTTRMNDPFDSLINLWSSEENLRNTCSNPNSKHIKPFHKSFENFRIRSFCIEKQTSPIKNILMWSHYAGEHTGFCIKYKLSKHFINQEEDENNHEHMYLKIINYTDDKIDLNASTINSDLAFATKYKCWEYENEVRLIVYNSQRTDDFYGICLDEKSTIEEIFFGYRCPEQTITTIKNLFLQKENSHKPKFYKMKLNSSNVYELDYQEI